jgi:hypothetical protein
MLTQHMLSINLPCVYIYIYNKVDACRKQLTSGCGLYWRNVAPSPTLLLSTLAKFNRTGLANLFSAYRKKTQSSAILVVDRIIFDWLTRP